MTRLSRAETQERNRAKVLAAAREEFSERGFRDAKIDVIAERAEFTRGAVYSNFPSKRALYFAVLADIAENMPAPANPDLGHNARDALGSLARAWVVRLPLALDGQRLGADLMPEVLADVRTRRPFAQLMKLDALLLGLALENLQPSGRMVRVAQTVLTTLHGASQLAAAAPGFVEPFDIVSACEQMAGLTHNDVWPPPPVIPQPQPTSEPWAPPTAFDAVRAEPAQLTGDGVVAVLGLHRLAAAEQAVRAAPAGVSVTAVLVTSDPGELAPLARLAIADLCGCLRQAFPRSAWPRLQVVCDESGAVAAAAGVPSVSDETEVAVRIEDGLIVSRADGFGAGHAVTGPQVSR